MQWTSSTKHATSPYSDQPNTSKHCDDITADGLRGRAFNVRDLVLCLVHSNKDCHKLFPPWEGPFIIAKVLRPGTYKLQTADGEVFTNAWNIE
jgi:hypothetical protein